MLIVKFESPPGKELSTRNFQPGQAVRIWAYTLSSLGIGAPGRAVTYQVTGLSPAVYKTDLTDFIGHSWVDVNMPVQTGKARVLVHVDYGVGSDDADIPIFVGNEAAQSNEAADAVPTPEENDFPIITNITDTLSDVVTTVDETVKGIGDAAPKAVQVATWGLVIGGLWLLYLYTKPKGRFA